MAEMSAEDDWVSKLSLYNRRHGRETDTKSPLDDEESSEVDERLLEEYYIKFKGNAASKYSVIPKFYSKVQHDSE
jgi:hypothetical protein